MKRFIALLLCCCICVVNLLIIKPTIAEAASKNEYSVKVGKKITLETNMKNAVWGSDDVSIATVTSKGVVKGVSKGSCTIVATSKGKSELFFVTVSSSKKSNKTTLKISKNGITLDKPKMNISGVDIVFGETTVGEISGKIESPIYYIDRYGDLEDASEVDVDTKEIYGEEGFISLTKWKWYVFKTDPGQHQYYKEMVISTRNIIEYFSPFSNGIYLTGTDYYVLPTFSAKNAPPFDTFETDIYKKFSGYTTDNIKITRISDYEGASDWGSHPVYDSQDYWTDKTVAYVYIVKIKDANTNKGNSSPCWWDFCYFYDKNRKCIGVSFYYEHNY